MKTSLRFTAKTFACILVIAMATSIIGAAITQSRSENVNTTRGTLTTAELQAFFSANRTLLQDIAEQLIPLHEDDGLYLVHKKDGQVVAQDADATPIALGAQLQQQLEQYFNAIGTANAAKVKVYKHFGVFLVVNFSFTLDANIGHKKAILYSTDPGFKEDWEWSGKSEERLDADWFIVETLMPGKPIEPPCWTRLPAWLQWILRYVFFGWLWMKPW